MGKYLPLLAVLIMSLPGCTLGQGKKGIWKNEKIDPAVRAKIADMDDRVFRAITTNNADSLTMMFSDTLKKQVDESFFSKFVPQIQRVFAGRKYRLFDEFYMRPKVGDTVKLASGTGDNAYTMNLQAVAAEMYLSMFIAGDSIDKVMLTLEYTKNNGDWQLQTIRGEDYSLNNQNAVQQYRHAQELEKDSSLIDAVNVMSLSNACAKPGGRHFKYDKEPEINAYADSLKALVNAKYPIPYHVKLPDSKPLVINIHYEVYNGTFIPLIMYQSSVSVIDTELLKKENDRFQQNVGSIFAGIDRHNKTILYRAYNELPTGKNNPRYYGFIQRVDAVKRGETK